MYETTCATPNEELIRDLVMVWNTRILLGMLSQVLPDLGKHGVMRKPEDFGIDHIQEQGGKVIERGPNYQEDPLGQRTGNGPGTQMEETLNRVATDATNLLNSKSRVPLTKEMLKEKLDNIRGAVTMAYPMGLPKHDSIRVLLEEKLEDAIQEMGSQDAIDPATAQLWWAGKEFFRDGSVSDRVGKNEKTKIIVKLTKSASGAPQREPGVSEDERKAMMAHYFKKQEELKALAEADADDYLHSSWANPSALKQSLRGTTNIRPF